MAGIWSAIGTGVGAFFGGPVGAQLGGAFGSAIDGSEDRRRARDQQRENTALQREFAQNSISWRVRDAQNAGLHPLFALGGAGSSYSPNPVYSSDTGNVGPAVASSMRQTMTVEERNAHSASLLAAAASAEKDHSMAAYYRALAAKAAQSDVSSASNPGDVVVGAYREGSPIVEHPLYSDAVKLAPDELVSRSMERMGETAGRAHPSFREFAMPNGDLIILPATGQGGIPEEIDATLIPEIIGANIHRFGSRQAVLGALHRWFGGKLEDRIIRGPTVSGRIRY